MFPLRSERVRRFDWLRERPFLADSLLALSLAVIALGAAIGSGQGQTLADEQTDFVEPGTAFQWVILVLPACCVALRRKFPTGAMLLGALAIVVVLANDLPNFFLAAGVLFYSAVTYGGRRGLRSASAIGAFISLFTFLGWAQGDAPFYAVLVVPLIFGMAISLGLHSVSRAALLAEAEERAKLAERSRQTDAQRIVDQERGRIARELHDVVAHGLSMIAVQAGGAKRVLANNPEAAVEALGHIEDAARDSLTEMRQVLGVLRSDEDGQRRPTPGLSRLPELVENVRESGLAVTMHLPDELSGLPSTVDTGAYRIIQEALTNVMKHGGPSAEAVVTLMRNDRELQIDVIDTGRGAASVALANGTGHGLVGMKERAAVSGGTVRAGPKQGGGYRVAVSLPIAGAGQ